MALLSEGFKAQGVRHKDEIHFVTCFCLVPCTWSLVPFFSGRIGPLGPGSLIIAKHWCKNNTTDDGQEQKQYETRRPINCNPARYVKVALG